MSNQFDVIVVGAGPGGSEAAFQLARLGISVLVLEKGPLLREKSCGGGIQTQEIVEFGHPPEDAIERWITTARVYSSNNQSIEIPQFSDLCGATVKRLVYDGYLQERAQREGAVYRENHQLTDINLKSSSVSLTVKNESGIEKLETKLLVFSAGAKCALLRKQLKVPQSDPERTYLATQAWIQLDERAVTSRVGDTIELYGGSTVVPEGYGWIFPKKSILSVGLGTSVNAIHTQKLNLRTLLDQFVDKHPVIREKVAGGKIIHIDGGIIPARYLDQLIYGRVLVLGDAAGMGNALHGGGIYQARKSAKIAAPFVQNFLNTNNKQHLVEYDAHVKQAFWDYEGRWDNKMIRFFHKDNLLDSAVALGNRKPKRRIADAFSIILNSTDSHEQAYLIFEKAMLDIIKSVFENKAKPYRKMLEHRLKQLGGYGPLLDPSVNHILFADAKRFRATLTFLAFELYSKNTKQALPVACAYELLHTASLIHDDIMDGARIRRGQETVHEKFGNGAAITAGDLLIFQAYNELLSADWSAEVKQRVSKIFSQSGLTVSKGQGIDLHLTRNFSAWSIENYLEMIKQKTGGLIESPLVAGAVVGGAPEDQLELLEKLGIHLGMAFQIIDDSNDLLGSEDSTLKALYGDLVQGKCTAIMVYCYIKANERQRLMIQNAASADSVSEETAAMLLELCRSHGAIAFSQKLCGESVAACTRILKQLPESHARVQLEDIINIVDDWCSLGEDIKPYRTMRSTNSSLEPIVSESLTTIKAKVVDQTESESNIKSGKESAYVNQL